jgi:hypothetical protein
MLPTLFALVVTAAALAAGLVILYRLLPRPGVALRLVCVRCGVAAEALQSFTCPGCGHDVREMGLARSRGRSPTAPFWTVVVFTLVLLFLLMVGTGAVASLTPTLRRFETSLTLSSSSSPIAIVELEVSGIGPAFNRRHQDTSLSAELYTTEGTCVPLRFDGRTGRWTLGDAAGAASVESGEGLDEALAMRWAAKAGLDPADPRVADAAVEAVLEARANVGLAVGALRHRGYGTHFNSRSGNSTASYVRPRGAATLVFLFGATAWVMGLWLILRPRASTPLREDPGVAG